MDKGKILRLVLIPVIIGLVVTLIVRQVLSESKPADTKAAVEMVSVVAVTGKEAVPVHTKLTEQHLGLKQIPRAFATGTEFSAVSDLVGQVTTVQLEPGEVILRSRVVPEGKGGMIYRIPKGARAVTIRIDELSGVAGFPEPGDLVDLVLILQAKPPERPAATSRILYEQVPVLGKGPAAGTAKSGTVSADVAKLTSLTLALQPEQAVEVALAEQIGLIKVLLRPAVKEADVGRVILNDSRFATQSTAATATTPTPNR